MQGIRIYLEKEERDLLLETLDQMIGENIFTDRDRLDRAPVWIHLEERIDPDKGPCLQGFFSGGHSPLFEVVTHTDLVLFFVSQVYLLAELEIEYTGANRVLETRQKYLAQRLTNQSKSIRNLEVLVDQLQKKNERLINMVDDLEYEIKTLGG